MMKGDLVEVAIELKEKCEVLVSLVLRSELDKAKEMAAQIDRLIREFERKAEQDVKNSEIG